MFSGNLPDSAYWTEATLRTSRPFEPDETLVKPTELSFETCRDITPAQCRSAPSRPKKARTDDGTIPRHVSHELRSPRSHISEGCSVDSESSSAIFGVRIWTEVLTMDRVRICVIRPEWIVEAKSVIRQEDRTTSVMWIHRLQMTMSVSKLPNQGTFWNLRNMTARLRLKHSGHSSRIVPCTIDGPRPNS